MAKRAAILLAAFCVCAGALLFLVPMLTADQKDLSDVTAFKWTPALSAHEHYPAELITGILTDEVGGSIEMRGGKAINPGWGEATGLAAIGPAVKPMPARIELQYFSYAEDAFYGATLDLPQTALSELFAGGFDDLKTGARGTYDTLVFGLGADGNLSLWAAGDGHTHQVETFDVPKIDLDWSAFQPDSRHARADFIKLMKSDLGYTAPINPVTEPFARYKQSYPWTVSIVADGPVGSLRLSYLNGEREFFNLMRPFAFRSALAPPRDARLTWTGTDGQKYVSNISFNEVETLAAFEEFGGSRQGDLRLELRVSDTNRSVLAVLRDDARFYQFEDAIIKVYRRSN